MEEKEQQKKRLDQQMRQAHVKRMEYQKVVGKHADLQKVCKVSNNACRYVCHCWLGLTLHGVLEISVLVNMIMW